MGIIYPVLISAFIANMSALIRSVIQFFALFFWYMFLYLTSKNIKMTKVRFLAFEILVCCDNALTNKAAIP